MELSRLTGNKLSRGVVAGAAGAAALLFFAGCGEDRPARASEALVTSHEYDAAHIDQTPVIVGGLAMLLSENVPAS